VIGVQTGAGLAGHADFGALFRDWLVGRPELGAATAELEEFFAGAEVGSAAGAAWASAAWREAWLASLLPDLPDDAARDQARRAVRRLGDGRAQVVITGQQPGFLGGPLYTLYKIAAAVVLAELRTAAGHATVPVFWSGDDDDDYREALQPVAWDPGRAILVRHADHGRRGLPTDRMVGELPAAEVALGEAAWLDEIAGHGELARDLAARYREAVAAGESWSRLQRRAMLRIFAGHGLLVVHGNDARLHEAAAPFYQRLWDDRARLRDLARSGGRQLAAAGYPTAVSEPSIQRFLHLGRAGRRQPLAADHAGQMPGAAELRPGVVARSLVQDWLFRPAGVVVGPGEVAYLKQLAPIYAAFELPRAPLLPRLFAQLGPAGHGAFRTWALGVADRAPITAVDDLRLAAQRAAAVSRVEVLAALRGEGGVDAARAEALAEQVLRRWTRHFAGILQREQQRRHEDPGAGQPAWLRPEGRRQERSLAAFAAAALWGDAFIEALAHAGRRHFDAGLDGDWREFLLTVPEP